MRAKPSGFQVHLLNHSDTANFSLVVTDVQEARAHQAEYRMNTVRVGMNMSKTKSTPGGFEPPRARPSGFQVHPINHSGTVSSSNQPPFMHSYYVKIMIDDLGYVRVRFSPVMGYLSVD